MSKEPAMARPFLTSALAVLALGAGAPAIARTVDNPSDPGATTDTEETGSPVSEKLRARLAADGYKDITILPMSYAVSATDKDGKPVLLLIGPAGTSTVLDVEEPSTAQSPDDPAKQKQMQQ
jgi:hypothetical protein